MRKRRDHEDEKKTQKGLGGQDSGLHNAAKDKCENIRARLDEVEGPIDEHVADYLKQRDMKQTGQVYPKALEKGD